MESCCVPPGFRFHPTEEELVGYYLVRKLQSLKIDLDVIIEIDLYKMEPWDIQARCKLGYDEQNEWYFFSHKDRKYPTGTRTNRATASGFWKATGRDKAVLSKDRIIGMRKTLVFYKGRAPNGRKTDWILHEYRLQNSENEPPQQEGWVVCRAFRKPIPNQRQGFEAWNQRAYFFHNTSHASHPPYSDSAATSYVVHPSQGAGFDQPLAIGPDFFHTNQLVELPQLESPSTVPSTGEAHREESGNNYHFTEWKNFDNLLGFQANDDTTFHPFQNLPPMSPNGDIEAQYHASHFLGCSLDS